jgi:hypothetical protein
MGLAVGSNACELAIDKNDIRISVKYLKIFISLSVG